MTPVKIRINESVSLSLIETEKFKTGMIAATLSLPMSREVTAYNTLLSGVLRRGSRKYPSMALLNKRLDELYASDIEIKTARQGKNSSFVLLADMLNNSFVDGGTDILDGVLEVMSELIMHPITDENAFPNDTVEKEKLNVIDAIDAEINNPRAYALDRCAELMHSGDGDFSKISELREAVSDADGKKLFGHYMRLLNDAELKFFYVGNDAPERVAERIKYHFSGFQGKQTPLIMPKPEKFSGLKEADEPFDVSQGKLCLGFRVGVCADDDRYFAAALFNEVFGGSPMSKLFMNVREKMSLCYYCSSSYDTYLGNITVSSGIEVSDVEIAKNAILSQLEDIRAGQISEAEMIAAKKSIGNWFRQIYDYPAELFAFFSTRENMGIQADPREYMKRFEAVTAEDITDIAKGVVLDTVFFLRGTNTEEEADDCEY